MVRNLVVEAEDKIRTINVAVQPASGSRHPRIFMGVLAENLSTQMSSLGSSFQYEKSNSMVAEEME